MRGDNRVVIFTILGLGISRPITYNQGVISRTLHIITTNIAAGLVVLAVSS